MTAERKQQQPARYPTVADVVAMLSKFPADMPVAKLSDESGTYWPVQFRGERLRWVSRYKPNAHDDGFRWVDAWEEDENNGTETEHVCL